MVPLIFVLWLLELFFKILRGLAWRVVEYSRGAFAAIVLLLTAAVGLYTFILQQ